MEKKIKLHTNGLKEKSIEIIEFGLDSFSYNTQFLLFVV